MEWLSVVSVTTFLLYQQRVVLYHSVLNLANERQDDITLLQHGSRESRHTDVGVEPADLVPYAELTASPAAVNARSQRVQ